jgi:hypothetical protein
MIKIKPDIAISKVIELLQFKDAYLLETYHEVRDMFAGILLKNLSAVKEQIKTHNHPLYGQIHDSILQLNDESLKSYLWQPEVSHRLLNYTHLQTTDLAAFFHTTLAAETARTTHIFDHKLLGDQIWSGNGDYMIAYDDKTGSFDEYEAPKIAGVVPLDFFSPYCMCLSQEEINESKSSKFSLYSIKEAEDLYNFMDESVEPILDHSQIIELIRQFNNVFMVKKQICENGKQQYISGSDGYFIGRTHIMNPDIVSKEFIAEVFVHEAIHSVLYIIEENRPWMPDMEKAKQVGLNVKSNWSGNLLTLRSYFQAIFVWFGIYNFWEICLSKKIYELEFVTNRLEFVRKGFQTLDIDDVVKKYCLKLPQNTIETIKAAKNIIIR